MNKKNTILALIVTVLWLITCIMMHFREIFSKQVIGIVLGVSIILTILLCICLIMLCLRNMKSNCNN